MMTALLDVAHEAGIVVMRHRAAGVIAETKADKSVVTAADREAEAVILTVLEQVAPGVPVVAEEESAAGRQPIQAERFFLVDPLDGTKEFLNGGEDFTVNIALIEHGMPVLGVVYAPAEGVMWWGDSDGAWRAVWPVGGTKGETVKVGCVSCGEAPRAVASKSHATPETETYLTHCNAGDRVSIGSSLKFLLVADGKADLYPRAGPTMEWDTAAGDAVLRAAGGMTYDLAGAPLAYGKAHYFNPGFVATGGHQAPALAPFYPNHQTEPGRR
jgi:3'(2'), 5'-bisphosphate nucleotidase